MGIFCCYFCIFYKQDKKIATTGNFELFRQTGNPFSDVWKKIKIRLVLFALCIILHYIRLFFVFHLTYNVKDDIIMEVCMVG